MATVIYSFIVRDSGSPLVATGLSPVFSEYRDIATLTDLSGSAPTIVEVGKGHYKFSVDWDTAPESTGPTDHIAIVIDAGVAIGENAERYITARINRKDNYATEISTIASAVSSIGGIVDTLFEVATGKWEVVSNQLNIYESDGVTLVKTFNLFDAAGSPTSTLPAKREPV